LRFGLLGTDEKFVEWAEKAGRLKEFAVHRYPNVIPFPIRERKDNGSTNA